jgi:hypothetical protein
MFFANRMSRYERDYLLATHRVAASLALELDLRQLAGGAAWEMAASLVDELLVKEPILGRALELSANVEAALDEHPGGREWLEGSRESAVRAVARFDVLGELPRLRNMDGTWAAGPKPSA